MAENSYKIHLGVKLNTSDVNTQISKIKASPIDIKTNLDTSGITKAISSYKSKPISIDSKLNTDGITEKIRAYVPPKKIHLESELSTVGIDKKINSYKPTKPIKIDVELDKSSINQQIANAKPTQSITVNAELKKSAISEAIRSYKSTTPIKVVVDPDFDRVDAVVKNYIPRNLLKVNVKLNKTVIDSQIKNFQTSSKIEVGAKLRDNAIETAIKTYAGKELVPITVDFKVGETQEITNKINEYKNKSVSIPVKLQPAQTGFDSAITKKPVRVQATLDPDGIDSVIDTFKPTSKIKLDVQLKPKDINGQVAKLPKPTDPLDVDVRLNSNSVNNAIAKFTPSSRLKVGVDLKTDDINPQIDAIHPTSKIKVNVNLDNSNINKETAKQNTQTPVVVNVKLDRDSLNEQIRNFKTQIKLKVGIKLDFVGVSQQIKDYKTKSKLKVGVELDRDSIAQQIATVKTDTPIKLGVELDPEGVNKIKGQVNEIKQQLEALGNVRINLGGSTTGAITGSGSGTGTITSKSTGSVGTNLIQGVREADITIANTEDSATELQKALEQIGFAGDDITGITNKFKEMDVVVNRVVTRLDKNKNMMLTIMGTDTAGRNNVTLTRGKDVDGNLVEYTKVSQKIGETVSFLKQQKKAAADLTNQINQINRAATDSNARKPIQDTTHLESLKTKYNEIIAAIEAMGNASSDTFEDERIKVKALISEYKSLKSEYKNAENVSTKYDGNSYSTGLEEARQDLIAFKREASNFPQIAQTVKELDDAFEKVGDAGSLQDFTRQLGVAKSALGNLKDEANEANRILTDAFKKIDSLSTQAARLNPETNPKQLAELSRQLEEAEADYESLKKAFSGKLSTSQFGTLQANADDLTNKLSAIEEKHKDTRAELAKKISIHLEAGKFTEQVARANSNANRLADTSQELKVKLEALHNAQTDMNNAFKGDNVNEQIASYRRYLGILENVENQIKINKIQERDAVDTQKLTLSKQGLSSDMTSWLRENSVAAKRFGDDIKRLQVQLKTCDNSVDFNNIKQEFRNVQKEAKALGLTGLTTFDKLKYKLKEYMAYFSVAEVFMYASQGLRDMFEQVKLIDSAMTELKKVTDETNESYNRFLENAAKRSKEIGTTIDGLVASTADFARLGKDFDVAQELAEVANIYAVVGDEIEGVEGATKSLVSTMAAFETQMNGMSDADFAMSIVDKFNEIGNNFAISSGGIGEALERSASSLMAANNTIDESIALITAANTVVQNPDAVGTAFKTISMRIRGAKTELEEAGLETEGMVSSTAKLREEIFALSGVDIMENANEFKSTYKIMDELAAKWKDLTDIQQATITELIAGKRQGNIVSSLMGNFDTARKALETSLNSSGSAMEEHEKWQKSLEAQILKLQASWQSLSQTFMSSKFLHGALEAVIGLVDGIESLIDTIGVIPTFAAAFGAFQSFRGKGFFKPVIDEATGAAKGITTIFGQTAKSIQKSLSSININNGFSASLNQNDVNSLRAYNGQLQAGIDKTTAWNDCMINASVAAQNAARSNAFLKGGLDGYIKSQQAANVSTIASNKSLGNAKALLNEYYSGMNTVGNVCKTTGMSQNEFAAAVAETNPQLAAQMTASGDATKGLFAYAASTAFAKAGAFALKVGVMALNAALTMGIGLIVGELISAIMSWINKEEELAEKVEEVTSKFKEQHEELQKLKGDFDTDNESSMISRYEKLSKGVDNLGRNVSLTSEEYSEYQSIVNKIADQIPSLVSGYDSQGNALLSCKGNVEELVSAYERLIHLQNQEILTNTKDIEENFKNMSEDIGEISGWEMLGQSIPIYDWFVEPEDLPTDAIKRIEKYLNNPEMLSDYGAFTNPADGGWDGYDRDSLKKALEDAGVEVGFFDDPIQILKETIETDPDKIKGIIDSHYAQFAEIVEQQKTIASAKLSEAFDISETISGLNYDNISEELQTLAYQVVSGLDFDFFNALREQGKTVEQWTTELLDQLNVVGKSHGDYIEDAFELQAEFNGGDIDYGDYIDKLREVESVIDGLDLKDEAKTQLKISLGLDENGVVDQYDALINRLTSQEIGLNDKAARDFVDSLSAEELAVLVDVVPDLEAGTTIDEIRAMIDDQLAEEFTFDIKVQTEGIEALNTALIESRSAAGLTSESITALKSRYEDLDGFNAAALFEKTATGIRLNADELNRLEEQYISTNKLEIDKNLNALVEKYQDVNNELKTNTSLTADERKELELSKESLADKIDELSTLASQYDGLTSAFNKWQTALNGAEEGDNYDSVFENLEGMKELDDAGLVGTDKYKTFAQLMSYEDLSTASIDEVIDAYEVGYKKAERYFTEGQKGSKNFLKDLNKINSEWAYINKNGDWEVHISAEEAAKELGISVDAVSLILDKLKDYGIKVEIEDTSVDNLQTEVEKTEAKLKELGQTPHSVNLDIEASAENLGTIETEIESVKTKITEVNNSSLAPEVKSAQLDDLRAKLEILIQKKQEASQPTFMNLDTSQVNASLVEALNAIQNYQTALNELNELKELKSAGIAIDDSEIAAAEEKIDGFAKAIQGLDGDVKVAIGLEEDGSIDSIKTAFEEGKVKIDADTDPALTKIELLAENVERIEDKDVTINVTVNGLDQVEELNRQIDLATQIEGDIDKLSEYVENAKELNNLDSNIVTNITANVKGNVTETAEYKLNNLKVFGDSAKHVKDIGSFTSKVTAEVKGNVVDTPEYKINNLKVFSDSANELESIGSPTSNVTAEIKGNVTETAEFKLNNLKVFTDNAKDIGKIGDVESKVVANVDGDVTETAEYKLNNLKVFTDSAKDIGKIGNVDSKVVAEIEGNVIDTFEFKINNLKAFSDNAKDLDSIGNVDSKVFAEIDGNVIETPEFKINNLKVFSDNAKGLKDIGSFKSEVTAEIKGNVIDEFEYKIDNLKVFSDSAKDLKSIGDTSSNVFANVEGNITDTFEYKINNLKVFSDSAKDLKKIGNISSKVVANVDGDVTETAEYKLNNLKVFSDSAKDLESIGSPTSNVTANVSGNVIDTKELNLSKIKVFADGANKLKNTGSPTSNVTADIHGNVIETPEYKINNLEVFADDAKKLKGVGSFKSEVTANVSGNVIDEFEFKINNLGVFADNAKNLKEIGDVSSSVAANVEGNIIETSEYKINNLKVFSDSAKDLDSIGNVESKVTANVDGNVIDTWESSINNLKVFYDSAKDINKIGTVNSEVTADVSGNVIDTAEYKINNLKVFSDSAKDIKNVGSHTSDITANVYGNVINTTEEKIDNLGVFATNANKLKNTGNFTSSVSANVSGNVITDDTVNSDIEHFASIVSGMTDRTITVSVKANVDSANINQAITLLQSVATSGVFKDYKATVQVGAKIATIDDTTVKNYQAPKKDGKVAYSVDPESSVFTWTAPDKDGVVNYSASVEALTDSQKYKTGTITYKAKIEGFPVATGTANADGSANGRAFSRGNWGIKGNGVALGGELGRKILRPYIAICIKKSI